MNHERWRKISELFDAALELPTGQRRALLEHACAGDSNLQRRVEAMLAADQQHNLLLDQPAHRVTDTFVPTALSADYSQSFSGEMIGDYQLIREIGRGGMGVVYLAYDTRLGRKAALKLLPAGFKSPERVRRLHREARSASALNHPHIITIYDFGQENDRYFIASEFVEGRTLRNYVGKPDLTLNQIVDVTMQVASALETAHRAGIIHRDIKPENIMLRPDGYAKVLDFGLAKLTDNEVGSGETKAIGPAQTSAFETRTGMLLGTVKYMSPEQVRAQKLDGRTDLFSLGVVLYELITGRRPFGGETWHHTMVAITDAEPQPIARDVSGTPPGLQQIVSKVLAKDRDRRYQTAHELLLDLAKLQAELPPNTRLDQIANESGKPISQQTTVLVNQTDVTATDANDTAKTIRRFESIKRPWLAALLAVAILVVAVGYFWSVRGLLARPPALTDKDTILLADFVNTTSDTDFDGTLKQGLTVQLEQSPYVNVFPEERARETLGLMERPRTEKITREVGREICQRRGIKVLMVGTIARLGRNYVITLEAINSESDEAVANQQTEAEGKEQVLKALGRASTSMREKLGESLASIRKFDAPIEQATTGSLDAFKDYTIGVELWRKGQYAESIPALKRAIERDDKFALAYAQLGTAYRDSRNLALGNQYLERAFELRDRVSERERIVIAATYYRHISGELDKRIEMTSLLTQTYPQDPYGHHLHGNTLMIAGEYEQAAAAYRTALSLDPDFVLARANLALALVGLNRFDEAREAIEQGIKRGRETSGFHSRLYLIAFLKGDRELLQQQVEWSAGKPEEYQILEFQGRALAFAGRRQEASKIFARAAALAEARGLLAEKARIQANEANLTAIFGLTGLAEKQTSVLLALLEKQGIGAQELQPSLIQQLDSQPLAWTLALCGDERRAQSLADDSLRQFPRDTIHNAVWMPLLRATLELRKATRGPVEAHRAIKLLPPSRQYEAALNFRPTWLRGEAYLQAQDGLQAEAEFQRIIDHRGWDVLSPLWPLAHLGLARAAVLQGDRAKARKAYEDFFRLWKDADAELPVLIEARREYEKLK